MVIADTGFWLALANRADVHHEHASERLHEIKEPFVTTSPVMTETCYLLVSRLGPDSQRRFIRSFREGAFEVFELSARHAERIELLMKRYEGLPMDLADASLVVLAEYLGDGRILSTDERDFRKYRWKERKPFTNVLLHA